jgi:two-component system chemotaxis response regulator CheY
MTKTVLAVDDSKVMRDMMTFSLEQAGYNVVQAEDGAQAMAILNDCKPDCILADISMPEMDGVELVRTLRATGVHKDIPILLLATQSEELKKFSGRHAGANGWITKPFNTVALLLICQQNAALLGLLPSKTLH